MEVFVSWTGADRDVKNAIVEKLQEAGIDCWDSDEYCVSDFSSECITAIKNSEVFIVIISDSSMEKGYVKNEVITARKLEDEGKLNILVYKVTDEPYTNGFEFQLNHISFTNGNLIQRKENLVGQSGIDNIVKRTKYLLQKRKDGEPEKPFEVKVPQIEGLKITKTGYFVENSRDDILSLIDKTFEESNVIVLKELFGFGKKSTIRKFAELHKDKYDTIIMVNNETNSLREFFVSGLEFENINSKIFEELEGNALVKEKFRQLEKLDEKTMLVVPDVKFESLPDEYICQMLVSLKCRIMLITQESADRYMEWFPVINLGKMSDDHLKELFFYHYPHALEEEKENLGPELDKFFAGIGGHTKTVELTASVLARDLGVYPEDIPQYLSLQGSDGMKLKDRIMSQISYLFSIDNLSETESIVLLVASYIAVPRISEINFRNMLKECGVDDWQVIMSLDKRRWLDVDMRNRTISIEPIIAKIIISKFPDNYFVITKCLDGMLNYSSKTVAIGLANSSYLKYLNKIGYMLSNIGFDEMAQLVFLYKQYISDVENFDTTRMNEALTAYENKYNSIETHYKDEESYNEEEYCDDEESYDDENLETTYSIEDCLELARTFVSGIIVQAKLIASGIDGALSLNFSQESQNILVDRFEQNQNIFNIEDVVGISKEELYEYLNEVREVLEQDDCFDEESIEYILIFESLAAIDAFFNRDIGTLMTSLNAMLENIEKCPEVLEGDIAIYFFQTVGIVSAAYVNTGAYHSAIVLCEKALKNKSKSPFKAMVLTNYIEALRSAKEYNEKLYDSYEERLDGYEKKVAEVLDGREDVFSEKKRLVLQYAFDLARGEEITDALKQFAIAQKIDKKLHPDNTVISAKAIVDALINSGEFEQASDFISENFPTEYIYFLRANVKERMLPELDDFEAYKNLSLAEENLFSSDHQNEYIDYYHNFSRKNNSFLEQKYCSIADKTLKYDFSHLSDEEITEYSLILKTKAKKEKILSLAPEAFALASEAGLRVLGYKHHYVQYMGAAAMADGKVSEILNGEGKTYTIVLVAFLNYIYGKKVFVIDSSPYLTKRNCEWMHGVYKLLGMSCAYIENQKQLYKPKSNNQADVIYTSTKDLIFAFLKSELDLDFRRDFIKYDCAIIDEIDSVLVDDAQTPYKFIHTEKNYEILRFCEIAYKIAKAVAFNEDYYSFKSNTVMLKEGIFALVEKNYNLSYSNINDLEKIKQIENILRVAIHCCNHYEKNKDYYIINGIPMSENADRGIFESFSPMFEFFIAKSNNLDSFKAEQKLANKSVTENSICVRDMFKKFDCVCGTTATAVSFKDEFKEIYGLEYVSIPPFSPCVREDSVSPVYIYEKEKDQAIISLIEEKHSKGQPVLVIAQSVKESEKYSALLKNAGIPHKLLNAKNSNDSSDMIALAGEPGSVLVATYLVNRGADIKLGGNPELKTRRELVNLGVDTTGLEELIYSVTTNEQKESSLYKKYYSVLEKNKLLMLKARQEVIKSGGLCVIGTSFFYEPRTEQQTRGRSGRQGEVGESIVFRSIEDEVIKDLFSNSFIQEMVDRFSDVGQLDSSLLNKQIQSFQRKLHANKFSKIRQHNNESWYIDKGRALFIRKQFELADGIISDDDIIREWAKDENVQNRIKAQQKGTEKTSMSCLDQLYAKYFSKISSAKGRKIEQALFEAFKTEVSEKFSTVGNEIIVPLLRRQLLNRWQKYIEVVEQTVANVEMSERALDKHFENERNRLYIDAIESLLALKMRLE